MHEENFEEKIEKFKKKVQKLETKGAKIAANIPLSWTLIFFFW